MKEYKIKVTYTGELNIILDELITGALELSGFEWKGQGVNLEDNIRDISFIITEERLQEYQKHKNIETIQDIENYLNE